MTSAHVQVIPTVQTALYLMPNEISQLLKRLHSVVLTLGENISASLPGGYMATLGIVTGIASSV